MRVPIFILVTREWIARKNQQKRLIQFKAPASVEKARNDWNINLVAANLNVLR